MQAQTKEKTRVLLVEDDRMTREALAYILEVEGYFVETAEDGKQGLELLHRFPCPSVVLLDMGLPIVNGQEFLERQKQDPDVAKVPVVVITAEPDATVPEATAVLSKPLHLPTLMELLSDRFGSKALLQTGL